MNVEEKVDSFHRDGFVKLANIIKTQELETIQADTQKIVDSPFHGSKPVYLRYHPKPVSH